MNNKHWFIAGQGSVGSYIAYNAMLSALSCRQITRPSSNSIKTKIQFHPLDADPVPLPNAISLADLTFKSIEYLIVPLKAYDVIPFLQQVQPFLADNVAIILCHNGLGTVELAANLISENMDLYFCTTSNGLYKNNQGVFQAGIGDSVWSHVAGRHPNKLTNDDLIPVFNRINEAPDLQQILWQKLVINCAINPLTAINKIKNGELAKTQYRKTITHIVRETLSIAKKEGVSLEFDFMLTKVYRVIKDTAKNYSSMYQDVSANKQNEIEFITGYIVKLAERYGVPCPISHSIYQQVKALSLPRVTEPN